MDGLSEGSALSDSDDITFLDSETRRAVSNEVSVSLFISIVLFDIVEIVSSDNDGIFHLVRDDHSSKDFSSNADISSEGTFFVNVISLNGFLGGFESESDISEVSDSLSSLREEEFLIAIENSGLFLVSLFFLFDHVMRFINFRFII